MTTNALACAGIFFLLSFQPETASGILAMAGTIGWGFNRYDRWIQDMIVKYDPPNDFVLVLKPDEIKSEMALWYWPSIMEDEPPNHLHNQMGMIVVDCPLYATLPKRIINFCFDALVDGGKVLVVDGRHVKMVIQKPIFQRKL